VLDHVSLAADLARDGLSSVLVCLVTEVDDIETRRAVVLAVVGIVKMFAGRESDVPGCKEEDTIVVAGFAKI
jgi:hypothetical protein